MGIAASATTAFVNRAPGCAMRRDTRWPVFRLWWSIVRLSLTPARSDSGISTEAPQYTQPTLGTSSGAAAAPQPEQATISGATEPAAGTEPLPSIAFDVCPYQ